MDLQALPGGVLVDGVLGVLAPSHDIQFTTAQVITRVMFTGRAMQSAMLERLSELAQHAKLEVVNPAQILIALCTMFHQSRILDRTEARQLSAWCREHAATASLVYDFKRNGADCESFERCCHKKGGPMVCVVQTSSGCVLGGFQSVGWVGDEYGYIRDPKAFLFSFRRKGNQSRVDRLPVRDAGKAVYDGPGCGGPCYGSGSSEDESLTVMLYGKERSYVKSNLTDEVFGPKQGVTPDFLLETDISQRSSPENLVTAFEIYKLESL